MQFILEPALYLLSVFNSKTQGLPAAAPSASKTVARSGAYTGKNQGGAKRSISAREIRECTSTHTLPLHPPLFWLDEKAAICQSAKVGRKAAKIAQGLKEVQESSNPCPFPRSITGLMVFNMWFQHLSSRILDTAAT